MGAFEILQHEPRPGQRPKLVVRHDPVWVAVGKPGFEAIPSAQLAHVQPVLLVLLEDVLVDERQELLGLGPEPLPQPGPGLYGFNEQGRRIDEHPLVYGEFDRFRSNRADHEAVALASLTPRALSCSVP